MKKKVALLTGGENSEREIALLSADFVEQELLMFCDVQKFVFPEDLDDFLTTYKSFDSAVPVFHGKGGEDGQVQGLLGSLGIPYIFSGVSPHAIGIDKGVTQIIAKEHGLRVPEGKVVQEMPDNLNAPLVIKSCVGGSSIGVVIASTVEQAKNAIQETLDKEGRVLIEEYVTGREFTVPVIDTDGKSVPLPVIEIRPKNEFFDFESKYDPDLVDEICPAPISTDEQDRLQQAALLAHNMIGARHLTRSDFIVDDQGQVWFLEINTIPGLTKNSLVPKSLEVAGISFSKLLKEWLS